MVILVLVDSGGLVYGRLESVVVISGVVDSANGTVGLHQGVGSLDHISIASLLLGLDVSGVVVIHSVLEFVLGVRVVVDVLLLVLVLVDVLVMILLHFLVGVSLGQVLVAIILLHLLLLIMVVLSVVLLCLLLIVSQVSVSMVV